MFFEREENIAGRMVEAGDHGVGFIFADLLGAGVRARGGDNFEVGEMGKGFLHYRVLDFGYDDFHIVYYNTS